jgi:hypothetical protein
MRKKKRGYHGVWLVGSLLLLLFLIGIVVAYFFVDDCGPGSRCCVLQDKCSLQPPFSCNAYRVSEDEVALQVRIFSEYNVTAPYVVVDGCGAQLAEVFGDSLSANFTCKTGSSGSRYQTAIHVFYLENKFLNHSEGKLNARVE